MARRSPRSIEQIEGQLLTAALALGDSLDATSMPRLAEVAEIAVGTLYRIAPSKAELASRLAQIAWARFDASVFAPFPARLDLRARFALIWQRLMAFGETHGDVARFLASQPLPAESAFARASVVFARDGATAGLFKTLSGEEIAALVWGPAAALMRQQRCSLNNGQAIGPAIWDALCKADGTG